MQAKASSAQAKMISTSMDSTAIRSMRTEALRMESWYSRMKTIEMMSCTLKNEKTLRPWSIEKVMYMTVSTRQAMAVGTASSEELLTLNAYNLETLRNSRHEIVM